LVLEALDVWCARIACPGYDGPDEYEYLGFPEYTHITMFGTVIEALDRLRSIGFPYDSIEVVLAGRDRIQQLPGGRQLSEIDEFCLPEAEVLGAAHY
jgi:hypothetical protein